MPRVGPCNQSFNSYCMRKRIIRRCCVLCDGSQNTHRSSASKMATRRRARVQRNNGGPRMYLSFSCQRRLLARTSAWPSDLFERKSFFNFINYIVFLISKNLEEMCLVVNFSLMNFNLLPLVYPYIYFSKLTMEYLWNYLAYKKILNLWFLWLFSCWLA